MKFLTTVGTSKAIILPSALVKRYKMNKVIIEATEEGILIRPVETQTSFQRKMEIARKNKKAIYRQMEKEAGNSNTLVFYNDPNNTFEEVDIDILKA